MSSYVVHRTEWGIYVVGEIPVSDLVALNKGWAKDGYKFIATGVASALRASMAVVRTEKDAEAWSADINARVKNKHEHEPELVWLHGTDTGTSSLTIFCVLSEKYGDLAKRQRGTPSVPLDNSDLGRCIRLVRAMGWRSRLPEVAKKYPQWRRLVDAWDELEHLHDAGEPAFLYKRIKTLIGDG